MQLLEFLVEENYIEGGITSSSQIGTGRYD